MNANRKATRRAYESLVMAVAFLTVVPVPRVRDTAAARGAGAAWFPIVGALAGALAAGVRGGAQPLVGDGPATVLAIITLVAITGALHQDGLADWADGMGARDDRNRRLAVMRDPAIGSFGVLALLGWAMLLYTVLTGLTNAEATGALIAAAATGRWAALLHARALPPARPDGLGAAFRVSRPALAAATVTTIAIAIAATGVPAGIAAAATGPLVAGGSAMAARRSLGGRTGDTLGATVTIAEVLVCTALLLVWRV